MKTSVCSKCGEKLSVGDWPFCPHGSVFSRRLAEVPPIVVHRNAKGELRFPAHADAPVPKGYRRVEIPFHEAHKLEKEMNVKEKLRYQEHRRQEIEAWAPWRKQLNDQLRERMKTMSPEGRAFAQAALERYAKKDTCPKFDAGFHLPVLHFDSGHMEPYCDQKTGWKNRRD